MQATPIQVRETIQIAARTPTGMKRPAMIPVRGIHHASKLARVLPSQSREARTELSIMMFLLPPNNSWQLRHRRRAPPVSAGKAPNQGTKDAAIALLRS